MKRILLICTGASLLASIAAAATDPIVTDSRLITEERRVQILEAKLASLQREVNLIEDRKAIERLQQIWGHYVSEGMAAEAAALFSDGPAASIEYAQQGVYIGKPRIEAFLKASGVKVQPGELRETPVMQAVIHVAPDGQTAKGRWRSLILGGMQGQDGQWQEGPYENEYVKEGGVWKIAKLHFYPTALTDYDQGFMKSALPMDGMSALFPPDRPPTEVYRTYPSNYIPPFSFLHPVTGQSLKDLPQPKDDVVGRE